MTARYFFWYIISAGLILGLVVIISIYTLDEKTPPQFTIVDYGNVEQTVLANGIVKPSTQISVGAQVSGQLKKLYVKPGDHVKKGQLLAEIDPTLQLNELLKAKAELQSAEAQIQSAKALLKQRLLSLKRQLRLDHDGTGVKRDLEEARAQYESQLAQLKVNEAMKVQVKTALDTAKANLDYTRITAPIDGEVLGIITKEGQTIVSSQIAPTILVLANVNSMVVHIRISETDILQVHRGQPIRFFVAADPHHQYEGILGEIQEAPVEALIEGEQTSPQGSRPSAVYYNGEFSISNKDHILRAYMTAHVSIITAQAKDVLRIPVEAIGQAIGQNKFEVKVISDKNIQNRNIRIGISDGQYAEVKDGLTVGEKILLENDNEIDTLTE